MTSHSNALSTCSRALLVAAALVTSGCTWVKVSEAGAQIAVATAAEVGSCTKLGEVQSQTRDKVLLRRGEARVKQELIDLSRNKAANMGADTLVPITEIVDGEQEFAAYKCRG